MNTSNQKRITKRIVDALQPGQIVWDSAVKGFGVRCQQSAKVYILKTRVSGRQRWFSIGKHGSPWTAETARNEALSILGDIADGKDPADGRNHKQALLLKDLANMFLEQHVDAKLKPKTAKGYRDQLERLVIPKIGKLSVEAVKRTDIAKIHHFLRGTPYQANRVLAVLSKMFTWAEQRGYRPDNSNPCRHVEKYKEQGRERFLSVEELSNLADIMGDMEESGALGPFAAAAIRLLIFTGARVEEILTLQWAHVDINQGVLFLPDSKTGKKVIWLSAPAKQLLCELPKIEGNPYVIVGGKEGRHLINIKDPWRELRKRAGIENVRLHDLRHSFASVAASSGHSLPMIGKLLGHKNTATTQRYAHLADDPVKAANEAIGKRIAGAMDGSNEQAEVISLESRTTRT